MEKEIVNFIVENNLSPFNRTKSEIKSYKEEEIYKTKDAKAVHNKVLTKISSNFNFADTSNIFSFFPFTDNAEIIRKRQSFFSSLNKIINAGYLSSLKIPRQTWKPKYSIIAVTEDEKTFSELKNLNVPCKFLINEYDAESLENYEVVQVINCENFSRFLENLPQSVFVGSVDDIYLERYLELLSGWRENIKIISENSKNEKIQLVAGQLKNILELIREDSNKILSKEEVEKAVIEINNEISAKIKQMTVSGDILLAMLSKKEIPSELKSLMNESIIRRSLPSSVFVKSIPMEIDEEELDRIIRVQSAKINSSNSEMILKKANEIKKIPALLKDLSSLLLVEDFVSGINAFTASFNSMPEISDNLMISQSRNIFLDGAQPISFNLDLNNRCSILTGANSGGKTTLLEHIIQIISLMQLGLQVDGNTRTPLFTEVYYFAKNKGSANKGAFETLLTQMSKIKTGKRTLILADEIESVTEPGIAGKIISATADYFIKRGCFLVIATHLGQEIQKNLPEFSRVDGIEAKGLDDEFNLIVDHNPVLGRIAHSTPELIVEKMAKTSNEEYFSHLYGYLKK